jgi:type IV conjugative transfer system coupling protein TraD
MAINDKSLRENFIRGADTFWHRVAMLGKNVQRAVLFFLASWLAITITFFYLTTSSVGRHVALKNRQAALANLVFLPNVAVRLDVESDNGPVAQELPARDMQRLTERFWQEAKQQLLVGALYGFWYAAGGAFLLIGIQILRGRRLAEDEFLRGATIVSGSALDRCVKNPSPFQIGGVHIPADKFNRNVLLTGAMGTGKSQALLHLMDEARRQKLKCVIYDKTGEFTEQFFRYGQDVILNPLDARCAPWSVFADIHSDFDFSALSTFFVPDNKSSADPVWDNAARILLEDVFRIVQSGPAAQQTMRRVQDIITRETLPDLAKLLRQHGAVSAGTITEKNERASESVRLTLAASPSIKYFNYLPDPVAGQAFSVRDWVHAPGDSWLFLTSRADLHEAVRPFVSLWTELALLAVMTLRPSRELRLMFFLDELASLQRMRGLEIGLTESRKYGVTSVLGLQNLAQLDHVYGQDMAKVLGGNCQTKLILRVEDEATARRYADLLGKEEVHEVAEANSFGAPANRDGVNLSSRRIERHVVTPTEIQTLPDLTGYLKLPGDFPVGRVAIKPKSRPTVAVDFIPRQGLEVSKGPSAVAGNPGEAGDLY